MIIWYGHCEPWSCKVVIKKVYIHVPVLKNSQPYSIIFYSYNLKEIQIRIK